MKLSYKLLTINMSIIGFLVVMFLVFSYVSNKTLLSRAMNGVDDKAIKVLAKDLSAHYIKSPSWAAYLDSPERWESVVNRAFFEVFFELAPPPQDPDGPASDGAPKGNPGMAGGNKICDPPFGTFFQRLSLLDENKKALITPKISKSDVNLQPIKVRGETVGWLSVGKIDMDVLPLAEHFFEQQIQVTTWATVLGGVVAVALSFLLSRHITSPLKQLTAGAERVARRDFHLQMDVNTKDELADLAKSFNAIARELRTYEQQQKQWLMDISHELRTPLTIVIGEIAAICDNITEFDESAISSLQEEVLQIKRLVDDLHEIAAMDKLDFSLSLSRLDIREIVDQQVRIYQQRLLSRDIRLFWQVPDEPVMIDADKDRLAQVLRNILENNLRYGDEGGQVWLDMTLSGSSVVISVEDSGPGVDPQSLSRLFDRLYREDGSRNRITGGRGLGLAICQTIVQAHGGNIAAQPSQEGGLAIRIVLPVSDKKTVL